MQAPPSIPIAFEPSRLRIILVVILHLAAAFSWLLGFGWGPALGGVGALLGLSLWREVRNHRQARGVLQLLPEGRISLCLAGMPEAAGHLLPSSTVHHRVLWLHWQEDAEAGKKRRGALMLCRDQCGAEAWRCLQVYLRLEVVAALARPAVPDALG